MLPDLPKPQPAVIAGAIAAMGVASIVLPAALDILFMAATFAGGFWIGRTKT